jgi:hypothetical protein
VRIQVDFTFTLMRWEPAFNTHVPSGAKPKTWYFRVDPGWIGAGNVRRALDLMFRTANTLLRARQPDDINYLAALTSTFTQLDPASEARREWLNVPVIWEPSCCYEVDSSGTPVPIAPESF